CSRRSGARPTRNHHSAAPGSGWRSCGRWSSATMARSYWPSHAIARAPVSAWCCHWSHAHERPRMRILVVDDDVELVGLLQFALANAGYEVITAFDGEQAMAQFAAHTPELVVLDVNLPRLDGFEVLAALRRNSEVPVMMLTVRAAEE